MKRALVLVSIIFLAGCIGGGSETPTRPSGTTGNNEPTYSGEELTVYLDELPQEIVSGTEYFKIVAEAEDDIESVSVLIYNLGSYLTSPCDGKNTFRDIGAGETKEVSCSLKLTDEPLSDVDQEIMFEATYKVKSYVGQIDLAVYDSEEFERVNPATNPQSVSIGESRLEVSASNIEEGERAQVSIVIDGALAQGDLCRCSVESAILKVPQGFSVSGLESWNRYTCGSFNCYEIKNVDAPFDESFYVSIAGVTKTDTFYIGAELSGIWKSERGSETISIPSN